MIPRFVIQNAVPSLLEELVNMGYIIKDVPLGKDIVVLGESLLNSTIIPEAKNPLLKVFDGSSSNQLVSIRETALLQRQWTAHVRKQELVLGEPPKGKVVVSPVGIMIDSCVIPIGVFRRLKDDLTRLRSPLIASHVPVINPVRPFMTIGCV